MTCKFHLLKVRLHRLTEYSIAQAKTGTGKTLGFLLPIIQNIIKESPDLESRSFRSRPSSSDIRAIIISPTRELAEQIAVEAKKLVRNTGIIVQTAVGGTLKNRMLSQVQREGCHLLVGTPGRLNDILSDRYTGVSAPKLNALVLDEADRLLETGFAQEIDNIMRLLPDRSERDRQTLMFSATVPKDVIHLVRKTLKPDFQFVKCVSDDEIPTHERVPQKVVMVPGLENQIPTLLELFQRESQAASQDQPFKALVYFNTTAEVELASSIIDELGPKISIPPRNIQSIHGKLTQQQRTRSSDNFRRVKSGLLLSSDVTARGMDFPDVTHVIQVGLPNSRESYIHRLGRTGRAGKEGQGYLIITELEKREAGSRLAGLPINADATLSIAKLDMAHPAQLPASAAEILNDVSSAMRFVPRVEQVKVYMALLGAFQYLPSKQRVIDAMNRLAKWGWGMDSPPSINRALAFRMNVHKCEGVVLSDESASRDRHESPREGYNDPFSRKERSPRGYEDRGRREYVDRDGLSGRRGGFDRGRFSGKESGREFGRESGRESGFRNMNRRGSGADRYETSKKSNWSR